MRRTATKLPRMAALSPGIGSHAGLCQAVAAWEQGSRTLPPPMRSDGHSPPSPAPGCHCHWRKTPVDPADHAGGTSGQTISMGDGGGVSSS
jgi:hypothetical protein